MDAVAGGVQVLYKQETPKHQLWQGAGQLGLVKYSESESQSIDAVFWRFSCGNY